MSSPSLYNTPPPSSKPGIPAASFREPSHTNPILLLPYITMKGPPKALPDDPSRVTPAGWAKLARTFCLSASHIPRSHCRFLATLSAYLSCRLTSLVLPHVALPCHLTVPDRHKPDSPLTIPDQQEPDTLKTVPPFWLT